MRRRKTFHPSDSDLFGPEGGGLLDVGQESAVNLRRTGKRLLQQLQLNSWNSRDGILLFKFIAMSGEWFPDNDHFKWVAFTADRSTLCFRMVDASSTRRISRDSKVVPPAVDMFDGLQGKGKSFRELALYLNLKRLPTPTAVSDPKGGCTRTDPKRQRDSLAHAMHGLFGKRGHTTHLNPGFVAEMMGFPAAWTAVPFLV